MDVLELVELHVLALVKQAVLVLVNTDVLEVVEVLALQVAKEVVLRLVEEVVWEGVQELAMQAVRVHVLEQQKNIDKHMIDSNEISYYLSSPINKNTINIFLKKIENKSNINKINIIFNNTGGSVYIALGLLHFLDSLQDVSINTYNIGRCDSASILIYLSGKNRFCNQNSTFLFHSLQISRICNQTITKLLLNLKILNQNTKQYIFEVKNRTNLSKEIVKSFLTDKGKIIDAYSALNYGISTNICNTNINIDHNICII